MGINDVRKALQDSAGPDIVISNVTLGYENGGVLQVLSYAAHRNGVDDPKFSGKRTEVVFAGHLDPIEQARSEGLSLAQLIQES